MNTGLIQTLLESVQALQASVKAIEAKLDNPATMAVPIPTEALESELQAVEEPIKKHPLEDYKITEKDIGSLVVLSDPGGHRNIKASILLEIEDDLAFPYKDGRFAWQHAKPYLDPVALHFKPWHATDEDVPPSDLKDGKWYAMLMEDGSIDISCYPTEWNWNSDDSPIIGYRPLSFVNPILDEEK